MKPFIIYSVKRKGEQFGFNDCVSISIVAIFPLMFLFFFLLLLAVVVVVVVIKEDEEKEEAHFFYFSLLLLLLSSSFSAATHLLLYISIFPFYLLLSVIPISFNMYLYDTCFFIVFLLLYYIYTDGAFVLIRTSCSLIIQMTMILHYQPYMIESNGRFVASIVVLHLRCKEDPFFLVRVGHLFSL